jgi:hypothetical protein
MLRTPLQVTNRMLWVLHYLRVATFTINELREAAADASEAYSKACKQYKFEHRKEGGTVGDRDDAAQLANWDAYSEMVKAELAHQYAKEKKSDLKDELSALQTEAKLVLGEMAMAGRGLP